MKKITGYASMLAILLVVFAVMWAGAGHIYQKQSNAVLVAAIMLLSLQLGNRWLCAFGLYVAGWLAFTYSMVFSGIWHPVYAKAMMDVHQPAVSFFLFGMVVFVGIYGSRVALSVYADGICIMALVMVGTMALQVAGHDPISSYLSNFTVPSAEPGFSFRTPAGFCGNSNFAGAFLAMSIPFFLRGEVGWVRRKEWREFRRGGWLWFLPVVFAGLLLAHSAMAWIAVILGMFFYFFGFWGLAGGVAVSAAFLLTIDHHRFNAPLLENARFSYWSDAIGKTLQSWHTTIFGYGPGISWKPDNKVHSEYVAAFFNYGLIGVGLVAGYLKSLTKAPRMLLAACLVLAVNCIGNHPLHVPATAMLAVTILALTQRSIDVGC